MAFRENMVTVTVKMDGKLLCQYERSMPTTDRMNDLGMKIRRLLLSVPELTIKQQEEPNHDTTKDS